MSQPQLSAAETAGPSFNADPLAELMVSKAVDFYLNGAERLGETSEQFRTTFHNLFEHYPSGVGKVMLAGGLLKAGFTVEAEPPRVIPPTLSPQDTLDKRLWMTNYYLVAPTLIDMGTLAAAEDSTIGQQVRDFPF